MKLFTKIMPLLALVALVWPVSVRATERQSASQVADHLASFEMKAAEANRTAQELESLNRSRVSRESHAHYLNTLRDSVNEMGSLLQELETIKPAASHLQAKAIEHARLHLEEVAARLEGTISSLNSSRHIITNPDYQNGLREIASNTDLLAQKVDAILDLHQAGLRLEELDVVVN